MGMASAFRPSHDGSVWTIVSAVKAEADVEEMMACETRIRQLTSEMTQLSSAGSLAAKSRLEQRRTKLLHRVQLRQIMVEVERVPAVRAVVERFCRLVSQWRDARHMWITKNHTSTEESLMVEQWVTARLAQILISETSDGLSHGHWKEMEDVVEEVLATVNRTLTENAYGHHCKRASTGGLSDISTPPVLSASASFEHLYSGGEEDTKQEESLRANSMPSPTSRTKSPPSECSGDPMVLLIEKCKTLLASPTGLSSSSSVSSCAVAPTGPPPTYPIKKTVRIVDGDPAKYQLQQDGSVSNVRSFATMQKCSSSGTSFNGPVDGVARPTVSVRPPRSPSISLPSFSATFVSFSAPRRLTALSQLFALSIILQKIQKMSDCCNADIEKVVSLKKDFKYGRKSIIMNKEEQTRLCALQSKVRETWEELLVQRTSAVADGCFVSSSFSRLSNEEQYMWKEVWTRYLS